MPGGIAPMTAESARYASRGSESFVDLDVELAGQCCPARAGSRTLRPAAPSSESAGCAAESFFAPATPFFAESAFLRRVTLARAAVEKALQPFRRGGCHSRGGVDLRGKTTLLDDLIDACGNVALERLRLVSDLELEERLRLDELAARVQDPESPGI